MKDNTIESVKRYVAYYRASTERQRDGLGIEAQKAAVKRFIEHYGGILLAEHSEIVSGAATVREAFDLAVRDCKVNNGILLVHRIDRLSRAGFVAMARLEEEGIPYIEADSPFDTEFSKHIKFLVAKEERDKIRARVKDTLTEVKKKIEKDGYHVSKAGNVISALGSPHNLTDYSRQRAIEVKRLKARTNIDNIKAWSVAKEMLADGETLTYIADFLNRHGFRTPQGGVFRIANIRRLQRIFQSEDQKEAS